MIRWKCGSPKVIGKVAQTGSFRFSIFQAERGVLTLNDVCLDRSSALSKSTYT